MSTILTVHGVSHEFTQTSYEGMSTRALETVTFEVAENEIVVLLGAIGAGKTTVTKIILDLLQPSAGEVRLFGFPPSDWMWKPDVGYLPESFRVHTRFTAEAFLRHIGGLRDVRGDRLKSRVATVLSQVGLSETGRTLVGDYSRDQIIRLGIAQAVLHSPRLLILDEPTNGLDAQGRRMLRHLLEDFRLRGGGVLLNSHSLSDVEMVADRIITIDRGQVVRGVQRKELLERTTGNITAPRNHTPDLSLAFPVPVGRRCGGQVQNPSVLVEAHA